MRALFWVCVVAALCLSSCSALRNANVKRTIDLTTSLARQEITVELTDGPAKFFLVSVLASNQSATAEVSAAQGDANLKLAGVEEVTEGDVAIKNYKFQLAKELKSGDDTTEVVIRIVTFGAIKPFPVSISNQREQQLVTYYDNVHFLSPYTTDKETTEVKLASSVVESHSPKGSLNKDTITYDKSDVAPYSQQLFAVHYQNNSPFVVAERLHRIVTLYKGSRVNIEEHYKIKHVGAEFKGIFNRLEFAYGGAATAVRGVKAVIPGSAKEIFFRDQIGNISTSTIEDKDDDLLITLNQRFPLFGGWQTDFYWGYDLPYGDVVKYEASGSVLRLPLASPLENIVVKDFSVEVILPPSSGSVTVFVDGEEAKTDFRATPTFLDNTRPTYTFKLNNVASPSKKEFEVRFVPGFGNSLFKLIFVGVVVVVVFFALKLASSDDAAQAKRRN